MQQPDISSILTLSVALNFGYLFVMALGEREISSRMEKARRLLEFSGPVFENMKLRDPPKGKQRQQEFQETYNSFLGAMRQTEQSHAALSAWIIGGCLIAGILSLLLLFYVVFADAELSARWKFVSSAALTGVPLASALTLWLHAHSTLAEAKGKLKDLQSYLTG